MKNPAGKYMIPGSSVRGAIRSVYETITDSCFVTSKVDQRITKRTTIKEAQFFKPSLLVYNQEKKGWELYKAERHLIIIDENAGKDQNCKIKDKNRKYVTLNGYQDHARWNLETLNNHSYGELIPFTPGQEFSKNGIKIGCIIKNIGKGDKTGYLYKGEVPDPIVDKMKSKKHFESVFEEIKMKPISIKDDEVEALKYTLEEYNNPAVNRCLNENKELIKKYQVKGYLSGVNIVREKNLINCLQLVLGGLHIKTRWEIYSLIRPHVKMITSFVKHVVFLEQLKMRRRAVAKYVLRMLF